VGGAAYLEAMARKVRQVPSRPNFIASVSEPLSVHGFESIWVGLKGKQMIVQRDLAVDL